MVTINPPGDWDMRHRCLRCGRTIDERVSFNTSLAIYEKTYDCEFERRIYWKDTPSLLGLFSKSPWFTAIRMSHGAMKLARYWRVR